MLRSEANYYQYFFFGGILGEILEHPLVGNYLHENKKILRELGITDVGHKTLSSFRTACYNAQLVKDIINENYNRNKKPLILFCHSKACLEVLLAVKEDVQFFDKKVHRIICVQPPFQGSATTGLPMMKIFNGFWPGLKCLNRSFYSSLLDEHFVKNEANHDFLKRRVVVVRGYKSVLREVSWIIMPSFFLLGKYGKNDGLVHLEDQVIPLAQYKEIILEIDHADVFTSKRLSKKSDDFRKGLMIRLINWSVSDPLENDSAVKEITEWAGLSVKKALA